MAISADKLGGRIGDCMHDYLHTVNLYWKRAGGLANLYMRSLRVMADIYDNSLLKTKLNAEKDEFLKNFNEIIAHKPAHVAIGMQFDAAELIARSIYPADNPGRESDRRLSSYYHGEDEEVRVMAGETVRQLLESALGGKEDGRIYTIVSAVQSQRTVSQDKTLMSEVIMPNLKSLRGDVFHQVAA